MPRTVSIGAQDFEELITENCFYVDKTYFIKEWWESKDKVTLITRPRRFGKTLNMNMLEHFFSLKYAGGGEVFENLYIFKEEKYRKLQGTYPVLFLSFAGIKESEYNLSVYRICQFLQDLYIKNYFLLESQVLTEGEQKRYKKMADGINPKDAPMALHLLSDYLYRYYGKKVIILLDEYDTPLQEAFLGGYWEKMTPFIRNLFNNTFKTNPYLERAVMTGITRVSKESLFSDLNNLKVITMTSDSYASCFGFTEEEVFSAMDEFGLTNKEEVKEWYDGFTIGKLQDIYNPWSIINFLDEGNLKEMNAYMNRVAFAMFSSFDGGIHPSPTVMPEKFYHGFVLGLLVDLADRYEVTSNRESGYERYDVILNPRELKDDGIILEFKMHDPKEEDSLEETVQAALKQIEEKRYEQALLERGVKKDHIRKYGLAFKGKEVLIG